MYIISKFKDYYDSALGITGVDKSIIYNRKTIEVENVPKKLRNLFVNNNNYWNRLLFDFELKKNSPYWTVDHFLIGFCGRYYLGFRVYKLKPNDKIEKLDYDIKYDIDEVKSLIELYPINKWGKTKHKYDDSFDQTVLRVKNYTNDDIFRKYNTPCFVYHKNVMLYKNKHVYGHILTINPPLKNFEFAKQFDSYTAFQEIQMYISGVLGTIEKETINISDKDKIVSHGFNKWSFRKPPKND